MELDELHSNGAEQQATITTEEINTEQNELNQQVEEQNSTVDDIDDDNTSDELSPLEKWLATDYGIEGGMIPFEDGSKIHFADLDEEDQVEVLKKLNEVDKQEVADEFSLNQDELDFISAVRQNKLSVQDAIEQIVQVRVQAELLTKESTSVDFATMSDDAIFISDLSTSNPELTEEELLAELEKAKTLKNYTSSVKAMREGFISKQQALINESNRAQLEQQERNLEADRKRIVQTAQDIEDISGIVLNDDVKNFLLEQIVEVNKDNDPKFTEEIFSDPEKLIKAVFWYHYGEDSYKAAEEYWKRQAQNEYLRGKKEAGSGSSSNKISFSGKQPTVNKANTAQTFDDLDSLHTN